MLLRKWEEAISTICDNLGLIFCWQKGEEETCAEEESTEAHRCDAASEPVRGGAEKHREGSWGESQETKARINGCEARCKFCHCFLYKFYHCFLCDCYLCMICTTKFSLWMNCVHSACCLLLALLLSDAYFVIFCLVWMFPAWLFLFLISYWNSTFFWLSHFFIFNGT